jgi:hypothetical protein
VARISSDLSRRRRSGIVTGMRPPEEHSERLDRLVQRARTELRHWTDAPEQDPGIALLELFAFLGDALSSYTDAVASESYLGSRRREADVGVEINGQDWQRVASLDESGPDDPHYLVTVGEDGSTVVEFGDGTRGRRPPSGGGLRVSYRAGRHFGSVVLQEGRVVLDSGWHDPVGRVPCGIHRGIVVDAADPRAKGRLLVQVPDLFSTETRWALPCLPEGSVEPAELPSIGETVWISFEAGDPDAPVWLGRLP